MPLSAGTRLGPYEILSALGAGGMGEVYKARDTRLDRLVAVKILPPALAADPQFRERFDREARAISQLTHPHICTLYDVGRSEARSPEGLRHAATDVAKGFSPAEVDFLVMEYLEGETLADRLKKGALPLDDALTIAIQIGDALSTAHRAGIVHRDLKPGNIMLVKAGAKLLDFGLAKANGPAVASAGLSMLPTTPANLTAQGTILGTFQYMAPEQLEGQEADARTDIFTFGAVLYEMLTGKKAFEGKSHASLIGAIMHADPPPVSQVQPVAPASLNRIVATCLAKVPDDRWQSAHDVTLELKWVAERATSLDETPSRSTLASAGTRALPWAIAGALAVSLALVLALWEPWRNTTQPRAPMSLSAELGADVPLVNGTLGPAAILSPDGTVLAFLGRKPDGGNVIYTRRLNQLKARTLSGTDGADNPFFSPDGQWIAFFAGGQLKKIPAAGGAAIPLCDAPSPRGGAWSEDGTIVFQPDTRSVPNAPLARISSNGGKPEPLTPLADGEVTQRWPHVLPGGRAVLFTSSRVIGAFDDANLVVLVLSTGARKVVQRGGYHGRYLRSGHLVYIHEGVLFAAPFDLDRLEVTAQPVPALEGIASNTLSASVQFAASDSGTLVYVPGQSNGSSAPIHWMDRAGTTTLLRAKPANWSNLRFAPDGRRLAVEILDGQNDIWIYDWARDVLTRLTSDPASDTGPVWTPDGTGIVFASTRANPAAPNLYWQRADGTGDAQRLTESMKRQRPVSWHPGGKFLAFEEFDEQGRADVMILPMTGDDQSGWKPGTPKAFMVALSSATEPMFSPDGRWLAYTSNETGRDEVYVRPFPGPGAKSQISTSGGQFPTWSRTSHELLYALGIGSQIMVARYSVRGDGIQAETPRMWPEGRFEPRGPWRMFDLHPDGERLGLRPASQTPGTGKQDHVTFIFNFFDELRRLAPAKK